MQLKPFYNKATTVSSRNNVTTFGDLPDCSVYAVGNMFKMYLVLSFILVAIYGGLRIHYVLF